MEKKIAGLLGAVAALGTLSSAQATPAPTTSSMQVNSYADLLEPIPQASALLRALDEQQPAASAGRQIQLAAHHHHHHHHHHRPPRRHHHHHHH